MATVLVTPVSLERDLAKGVSVRPQKLDPSMAMKAAITSLKSRQGPSALDPVSCVENGPGSASCETSLYGVSASTQNAEWTELPPPSARWGASMAYDSADGYAVLFGGIARGESSAAPGSADTWNFSRGVWTRIFSPVNPPPRFGGAMAYDAHDGYLVLFGGISSSSAPLDDTWKYSNGIWTNITASTGPSPRGGASITYDASPSDQYVVLFGGTTNTFSIISPGNALGDTWKFSGGVWTNITTSIRPSPRAASPIAYDVSDGYVVLFGGTSQTSYPGDTWKFSAGIWTNITSTAGAAPPYAFIASMTYDSADGYIIFNSGATWSFSGGIWSSISSTGPSNRYGSSMTYDAADGYVLLFGGGITGASSFLNDSWKFLGGTWTDLTIGSAPPPVKDSMTYDAADGYIVLVGLASFSSTFNTWKFSSGVWTNITTTSGPSPRSGESLAYDAADNYVVLTGGLNFSQSFLLHDTWKFSSGSWINITSSAGPGPTSGAMTYDAADGYIVSFNGGLAPGTSKFQGGVWSVIRGMSSVQPPWEFGSSMTYDAADGYVVLFGGESNVGFSHETWKFLAGAWTNITSTTHPSPRIETSIQYDATDGYVVLFGGTNNPNISGLSDTWKFLGGVWTNVTTAKDPIVYSYGSPSGPIAYDTADGYLIMVLNGNTWKFSAPPAFDYSLSNTGPVSISPGSSGPVTIIVKLTSGTAQSVTLSCVSGSLPVGISCDGFTVNPVSPTLTGAGSVLTISVGSSVTPGPYTFQVTGNPVGATASTATTTVSVTVTGPAFDFSISAPSTVTLDQGTFTLAFPIVATLTSGSPSQVTFSLTSVLPTGVTATFLHNPCSPSCTAYVSFKANTTATLGISTVEIQAVGGGVTKTASISLTVLIAFDFSLSTPSPSSLTVTQGSTSQSSSITATTVSGTPTRGVGFIATSTSLPAGITPIYTNDPCNPNPNCNVAISFSASDTAALGTFTITILAIGSDLGSRYAYITLTITAPSVSTVSCGHYLSCSVQSNATLSNIRFAGITIHVEADGPSGAHGYANVTVPKTAIPNVGNMHVFVDNNKLTSSAVTITSNSTDYFIYFTFTFHSPVLIDIQLTSPAPELTPSAPKIFGLDPTLFYQIIGALVAAVIVISAVLLTMQRRRTRPIASSA